jgi:hypothetical protein
MVTNHSNKEKIDRNKIVLITDKIKTGHNRITGDHSKVLLSKVVETEETRTDQSQIFSRSVRHNRDLRVPINKLFCKLTRREAARFLFNLDSTNSTRK